MSHSISLYHLNDDIISYIVTSLNSHQIIRISSVDKLFYSLTNHITKSLLVRFFVLWKQVTPKKPLRYIRNSWARVIYHPDLKFLIPDMPS